MERDAQVEQVGVQRHALAICDRKGCLEYVSPGAQLFFGRKGKNLVGNSLLSFLENLSDLQEIFFESSPLDRYCRRVFRDKILRPGGNVLDVDIIIAMVGRSYIMFQIFDSGMESADEVENISHYKEISQFALDALEEEKIANTERLKYLSTLSHEFRGPLSAIRAASDILRNYEHKLDDARRQERIEKIQKSVQFLGDLLDDALDISRAQSGLIKPTITRLNPSYKVKEIYEDLKETFLKGHQAELNLPEQTKDIPTDLKFFQAIVGNLIVNAAKFTPAERRIEVALEQKDGRTIFSVADEGIGIHPKDIGKIFTPFYRTSETGEIAGTGLGLALVKQFVELLQGSIEVKSEPGVGSRFEVVLPTIEMDGWESE